MRYPVLRQVFRAAGVRRAGRAAGAGEAEHATGRSRHRVRLSAGLAAAALAGSVGLAAPAAAATPTYALSTVKLADGRRVVLRWNPCQVITVRVNVAAVPARQRNAVLTEIRTALTSLSRASGLTFSYKGTTTTVPQTKTVARQTTELVIAVTTPKKTDFTIGNGVLGYGGYRYWQWTTTSSTGKVRGGAAIARGWVVLDVTGLMSVKAGFGAGATRGNVVLHELGHAVGLNHVQDRGQLLYPTLTSRAPSGYAVGDRTGLRKVGKPAGCLTVPKAVVSDLS